MLVVWVVPFDRSLSLFSHVPVGKLGENVAHCCV